MSRGEWQKHSSPFMIDALNTTNPEFDMLQNLRLSRCLIPAHCGAVLLLLAAVSWSLFAADEITAGKPGATVDAAKPDDAATVSFVRQIAPIFLDRCVACHGDKNPQADYQLNTFARIKNDGTSGNSALVAGKPRASALYQLLTAKDKAERMPQEADPLPQAEIDLIGRWIEQGARFDGPDANAALASIVPKRAHRPAPAQYRRPIPVTALAFSADGKQLVSSGHHELLVWNADDGALVRRVSNIAERTHGLAVSPDGKLLAVAAGTPARMGEVKLLDYATGELIADLCTTTDEMFDVEFSTDGGRLAACGADRTIRIYDVAARKELHKIESHADWVMAVAWSKNGKQIASAGRDKTARVFNPENGSLAATFQGHDEQIYDIVFSEYGNRVFSAGVGRTIKSWNSADGKGEGKKGHANGTITKLTAHWPRLWSAASDGTVRQFEATGKDEKVLLKYHNTNDGLYALALHAESQQLAVGTYDGSVVIYALDKPEPRLTFVAMPGGKEVGSGM